MNMWIRVSFCRWGIVWVLWCQVIWPIFQKMVFLAFDRGCPFSFFWNVPSLVQTLWIFMSWQSYWGTNREFVFGCLFWVPLRQHTNLGWTYFLTIFRRGCCLQGSKDWFWVGLWPFGGTVGSRPCVDHWGWNIEVYVICLSSYGRNEW